MASIREVMQKQKHRYMSNWQYSLVYTLLLAVIPHASWLAVIGVSLLTLRKGLQRGLLILLPVAVVYCALATKSLAYTGAVLNTVALFLPCFIGALVLRLTSTWHAVAGVFFILMAVIAVAVQKFAPDIIIAQFIYLQSILQSSQPDVAIVKMLQDLSATNQLVIASYVFGLQLLSIFLSACIALIFARAIQSRLYNVGGFKIEALSFRARKLAIFILLVLLIAVSRDNLVAMMLLPAVAVYFLLAGLSISASYVDKKSAKLLFLLFVPIVLLPLFSVPFYCCLGLFASLFSLRFCMLKPRKRG